MAQVIEWWEDKVAREAGMEPQWPTLDVVHQLFGSLPAAIESAGIARIDA
jgi:hypothetical protein